MQPADGDGVKGRAIHLSRNVYHEDFGSSLPPLDSCNFDATAMRDIAQAANFALGGAQGLLCDAAATTSSLKLFLSGTANDLAAGDYLIVTWAGYGIAVESGASATIWDRGWLLYGGALTLGRLFDLLAQHLADGVRVLIVSDSCFSGNPPLHVDGLRIREISREAAQAYRDRFPGLFGAPLTERTSRRASLNIIHIAACLATQVTPDGGYATVHSPFTQKIIDVIGDGTRDLNFDQFMTELKEGAPNDRTPDIDRRTPVSAAFEAVGPFRIA